MKRLYNPYYTHFGIVLKYATAEAMTSCEIKIKNKAKGIKLENVYIFSDRKTKKR